ncbi:MAG: ribosome maturation factor RimP [Acidimicrobiaceae bacterium]
MSSNVVDMVTSMVAPILSDLSLELYDLEFAGGILRVTIDTPAGGPAGVDIDQISLVTRLLGRELDHNDNAVPGRFTLEVTSPGLERTLRTPHHFAREVGKEVTIRLSSELDGRRRVAGLLVGATDSTASVRLSDSGETIEVPLSLVDMAKTFFVWETQPKPNSKEARDKRASQKKTSTHQQEANAQ